MTDVKEEAKAPEAPPPPGLCGQFLKDHGIESKRLSDSSGGKEAIELQASDLQRSLKLLRSGDDTRLDLLITVSGVDKGDTFESVYHLWSYDNLNELMIKVIVNKSDIKEDELPMVPSISSFWPAANWHERETYDLVGIKYLGHPYPRRILNPWDWEGHPLRLDYKQPIDALNDKNPSSFR
ncbi:MAG: NADH-quinone oxidoreductase subunit C [Candidatus Obscuribacterales bacterium]|nr:NADH-quinone oxidoreductase subunit C [Candidatus Obscuribacterales bacterium]